MRVDFPEIQEEKPPQPKHTFRLRFVAEIVVDEYDIWGGFVGEMPDPPQNVTIKKVAEHFKSHYDHANEVLGTLVELYPETLKTIMDVSVEGDSRVVELIDNND